MHEFSSNEEASWEIRRQQSEELGAKLWSVVN
ncbi:unnamed protein product, partial [marine sediment metagenome]